MVLRITMAVDFAIRINVGARFYSANLAEAEETPA